MTELLAKYRSLIIIWAISLLFVALNGILIYKEIFYLPLLPFLLFFVLVALVSVEKLIFLIVFFVPLSIPLSYLTKGLPFDLFLPTEPLLAGVMLLFFLKYFRGERMDLRILRHPVTLAIYFNLVWMFMTTITSTDLLVSAKYLLARTWFVISFYFLAILIFRERKNMNRYLWLYITGFFMVVVYTIVRHSQYGLNNQMMAHHMMVPFYKDHTSYGAVLAMLLPVMVAIFTNIKKEMVNMRFLMILLILFFIMAIIFSYTRAAWLSLVVGFAIWVLIKLKIRFVFVIITAGVIIGLFFMFQTQIMLSLERNRQQSSGKIGEHIESMSNVSTDQSNLERINRWSCAIRMWKERPFFGFGPGTYQFEYARFQRSYEKTLISTDFGNRGNAHSEYLGPLAESGLLGMLSMIIIIVNIILTGIRVYYSARDIYIRRLVLGVLIGFLTYCVHGFMNNFLDTDKASALFWGFAAMIVAIDVYHKETVEEEAGIKESLS